MRPITKLRYSELCAGIFFLVCIGSTVVGAYCVATAIFFGNSWSNAFWAIGIAVAARSLGKICRELRRIAVIQAKLVGVYKD